MTAATAVTHAVDDARAGDVAKLAALMAASPLLARYRITLEDALASLTQARTAGDLLIVARVQNEAATSNNEIDAFAWLSFAPRVLGGAAYLRLLIVGERAQNRGLGSTLLEAAEKAAAGRENIRHIYLLATSDNLGARRFYERHGYRHVGDLPGLVWPDLDEALYHKRLR